MHDIPIYEVLKLRKLPMFFIVTVPSTDSNNLKKLKITVLEFIRN